MGNWNWGKWNWTRRDLIYHCIYHQLLGEYLVGKQGLWISDLESKLRYLPSLAYKHMSLFVGSERKGIWYIDRRRELKVPFCLFIWMPAVLGKNHFWCFWFFKISKFSKEEMSLFSHFIVLTILSGRKLYISISRWWVSFFSHLYQGCSLFSHSSNHIFPLALGR